MSMDWKKRFEEADRERCELASLFHAIRTRQVDVIRTETTEAGYLRILDGEQADNNDLLITELSRSNDELLGFSSMVSHDLNAPLSHVRAYAELLLESDTDNLCTDSRQYLKKIELAAGKMQQLMDSLLKFAQVAGGSLTFTSVNLSKVVEDVVAEFQHVIAVSDISVVVGDLPVIDADELQIRQVFQNLIENSIKYSRKEPGVRIEITAPPMDVQGMIKIEVRDNGIGFNDKYAARLFEPLTRLAASRECSGNGLGLATVKKIVCRHNGDIHATGNEGNGAVFTLTLPEKT